MPSFDIENTIQLQEVDNAVNNTKKELQTRYDFRGTTTEVTFNKGDKTIHCLTEDEMKLQALIETLLVNCVKRGIDSRTLEIGKVEGSSKGHVQKIITMKEGISRETAQKIIKGIKEGKYKVQTAIHDDKVRVTGKKIDDLQKVISFVKSMELDIPVQFCNMKS